VPARKRNQTTTRRSGLQATVPIYLTDVSVDKRGFITNFRVACLPPDVDPEEITQAVTGALNLEEPERTRVYDKQDRPLLGHPGTPSNASSKTGRGARRAAPRPPTPGLVVVNAGGVAEEVCGDVTIVDFGELAESCYTPGQVEALARRVERRFGAAARATTSGLRDLEREKSTMREAVT
jgi:hypothetical protein